MAACPSFWSAWRDREADLWVVEVLREGCRVPFSVPPPLAKEPVSISSHAPSSIKGRALAEEVGSLLEKGAVELAPPLRLGFYNRVFVKGFGSLAPHHRPGFSEQVCGGDQAWMETIQSVLSSVKQGDWMVSLVL